jgi:2-(1,2-epoxy-1,2-dihydrophenyl)acetyl-CoA isomerase
VVAELPLPANSRWVLAGSKKQRRPGGGIPPERREKKRKNRSSLYIVSNHVEGAPALLAVTSCEGYESEGISYTRSGAIAIITFTKGDGINAANRELLGRLRASVEEAAGDESVRVVIITGSGQAFCAGADLRKLATSSTVESPFDAEVERLTLDTRIPLGLQEMPKVTIAAVNGRCAGAGLAVACAADIRYAAQSAVFNTAYIAAGRSSELGASWTLPRVVGPGRARELLLTGDKFDAAEAERIGLVSHVLPDDDLMPYVIGKAERIASFPAPAVAAMKRNLNQSASLAMAEMLRAEAERYVTSARQVAMSRSAQPSSSQPA